jgi:hypothetical protein
MFWALARVSFRAAKIVSCNKNIFLMVYDQNYHNCSTLDILTFDEKLLVFKILIYYFRSGTFLYTVTQVV